MPVAKSLLTAAERLSAILLNNLTTAGENYIVLNKNRSPLGGPRTMLQDISRRQFLRGAGIGAGGSAIAALGFGGAEEAQAQAVRPFKLAQTTETRNTCPYCSVACGIIMYGLGDKSKNAVSEIVHIEGDPDHPTNRGTLCPKGAALLD